MAYRVFISHGSMDTWVARQIDLHVRERCGGETFLDVNDVAKGDDIEQSVFAALRNCDELVVLLTPWSTERNWVWVEVGAARALGKRIVAVLYEVSLDQLERTRGATFLRSRNVVAINELDDYFQDLRKRIGESANG